MNGLFKIKPTELAMAIIKKGTAVEAGFVNNKNDLGKATNHGITQFTAKEYEFLWPLYNWDGDMRTLPKELAYHIYYLGWWTKLKLDRVSLLSMQICDLMFDFGINAGRRNCVRSLQRILNVHNVQGTLYDDLVDDGIMGGKTLTAIEAYLAQRYPNQEEKLLFNLHACRTFHYIDISVKRERNETFNNGWTDRAFESAKHDAPFMFKI